MTARLYLTVYARDDMLGASLGTVNEASELEYRDTLHGTGSGRVRINRYHTQAALLVQDRYVRVHSDNGVVGAFFLEEGTIDLSSENGKGGEFITWTGRGPMAILESAVMDNDSDIVGGHDPIDGFWDLSNQGPLAGDSSAHPITMFKRAIVEAKLQTPTGLGGVTHSSFTYDTDSNADPLVFIDGEWGVNVGDDLLTVLAKLDQIGGVTFRMSTDFELSAYLTYGTDLAGAFGAGTVRFEKGVNVATAIQRKARGGVARTHLIVGGAERVYTSVTDPDYSTGDVIRWGFLSIPETDNVSALQAAGLAHIEARKRQTDTWSVPLHDHGDVPASGIYEPGDHFNVGDTVTHHTGSGTYDANEQESPVAAITWALKTGNEANGDYAVIVEIGSTFHWDGNQGFEGSEVAGSQHTVCFCTTLIGGSEVVTAEDFLDYEAGNEFWSNEYGGGTTPVLTRSDNGPFSGGGGGTSWMGDFDLDPQSIGRVVTPGTTLRISGYSQASLDSYPCTPHGWSTWSWGVKFYDAADVEISRHVVGEHSVAWTIIPGDLPAWQGLDSLDVVVPSGAAYMTLAQGIGALGCQSNRTHLDEISVSGITYTGATRGTDDYTGHEHCAARCDHKHPIEDVDGLPVDAEDVNFTPTGTIAATNVQGAIAELLAEGGGSGLPWFDVTAYGAVGDGTTDDTAAFNDAIADFNSAGYGRLYIPGRTRYKLSAFLDPLTAPGTVMGDGMYASMIRTTSATANVFEVQSDGVEFERLRIDSSAGTPTAGAMIAVTAGGNLGRFENVLIGNSWIGIDQADGIVWTMDNCYIDSVRKYGIKVSNAASPDGGDWAISNSTISAIGNNPDAAIRIDSSGGGKIVNTKVNASAATTGFNHGIDVAIAGTDQTSILLIENSSFENLRGDALHMTQVGTALYTSIIFAGNQVSLASNNSGKAVSLVAEDAAGLRYVVVANNIFTTNGTARSAVQITNVDQITFVANELTDNFTSLYTSTTSTNVTEVGGGGATALDDLSDAAISSVNTGDMLRYDGSNFVNTPGRWEPVTTNPGGGPELVWDGDELLMTWVNT